MSLQEIDAALGDDGVWSWDFPLPDGIYFDLDAKDYFKQETRGSSDWVKLRRRRWGWWWSSRYNPDYKDTTSAEQNYGSALHAILLEGEGAYASRFIVEPDKAEFKGLAVTVEDMQKALTRRGYVDWPKAWKKDDFAAACRVNIPDVPVWANIDADFQRALQPGVKTVTAIEDRQLRFMHQVARGDWPGNEAIKRLLANDKRPAMAEVTVIATIDGIRRRWRFDAMFPTFDLDLKSLGNWSGRPLAFSVGDQLARMGWHIQRADYWHGRDVAYRMIAERGLGAITGGTPEQRNWLATWPEKHPEWDWVWLVYQKPAKSGLAPVIFPVWDDSFIHIPGMEPRPSALRAIGDHQLADAISFYRGAVEKFGLETPWAQVEQLHYADDVMDPHISLPHWITEDTPTEENAYVGG